MSDTTSIGHDTFTLRIHFALEEATGAAAHARAEYSTSPGDINQTLTRRVRFRIAAMMDIIAATMYIEGVDAFCFDRQARTNVVKQGFKQGFRGAGD